MTTSGAVERLGRLLGRARASALTADQRSLLELMREDNRQAGAPFTPSAMWEGIRAEFEATLERDGVGIVEEQVFNTCFSQSLPGNPRFYRYALWMFYEKVRSRDRLGLIGRIPPTAGARTGHIFEFEGRPVSWDQLLSIDAFYSVAEAEPRIVEEPMVVADLGAGWGRMGYVLKRANPRLTYLAFDLPEVLLLSMTRLPQVLPGESARGYREAAEGPLDRRRLSEAGLWFAGPQHLERVEDGAIDVMINISSFQEMTPGQVEAYLALIGRKVGGTFYTQQYWSHPKLKRKFGTVGGIEDYRFPAAWERVYLRNPGYSERYFEAAFRVRGGGR